MLENCLRECSSPTWPLDAETQSKVAPKYLENHSMQGDQESLRASSSRWEELRAPMSEPTQVCRHRGLPASGHPCPNAGTSRAVSASPS